MPGDGPLRALLVEDSLVQRAHLARVLQLEGDIEVVAQAADAPQAVAAVAEHRPDVVTMDLDLPGGGGRLAIEQIMRDTPVPILVLSGIIDDASAQPAVEALAAGAVDALPKPLRWTPEEERELRDAVRSVGAVAIAQGAAPAGGPSADGFRAGATTGAIIAVAASTGGPAALTALLRGLSPLPAPVLIVQHIHAAFVAGFATWLGNATSLPVRLASDGEAPAPGTVYVAPGDSHLAVGSDGSLRLKKEPVTEPRPSADVLFRSLADTVGGRGIGVILTGMGDDGAAGLFALRQVGGRTFGQDEESSTVFGMAQAAEQIGATEALMPPEKLAGVVLQAIQHGSSA